MKVSSSTNAITSTKVSKRYDVIKGLQPQTTTVERANKAMVVGQRQSLGSARDHTSSQTYRAYSGAAWWKEAQLLSLEETRFENGIANSQDRATILPELPDRSLKAAIYLLENFNQRPHQDVVEHLKTSEEQEDHVIAEVLAVLGNTREVARTGNTREISIHVPENSKMSDESWERLMDLVKAGQEQPRENHKRVSDARRVEIRKEAQTAAWKELAPLVLQEPDQILDSPAEVLYQALDLKGEVSRAQSLQDRARTAHYAAEGHVSTCVEKAARALEEQRVDRAGPVGEKDVLRALVEATLDPSPGRADTRIVRDHEEQFALIKETLTKEDTARYEQLKKFAGATRDEYVRVFPEMDQKQAELEFSLTTYGRQQDAPENELNVTSERSPAMILYQEAVASRERELLTSELKEAIRSGQVPRRFAGDLQAGLTTRDLLPETIRADAHHAARAEAWLQLLPDEIRHQEIDARIDQEVLATAARVNEAIGQAQGFENKLEQARLQLRTFIALEVGEPEYEFADERARELSDNEFLRTAETVGGNAPGEGQEKYVAEPRQFIPEQERDGGQGREPNPANVYDDHQTAFPTIAHQQRVKARDEAQDRPLYSLSVAQLSIEEVLSSLDAEKSAQLQGLSEKAAEAFARLEQAFTEIDARSEILETTRRESLAQTRTGIMQELSAPVAASLSAYVHTTAKEEGLGSLDQERAGHHVAILSEIALANSRDASLPISQGLQMQHAARATDTHQQIAHAEGANVALGLQEQASALMKLDPSEHDKTTAVSAHARSAAKENAEGVRGADFAKVRTKPESKLEHTHEIAALIH
jgi:hypothetical protein